MRARLNELYVEHTGQDIGTIEDSMERDKFLSPEAAKEFGLIDEVVANRAPDEDEESAGKSDKADGKSDPGDKGGGS